MPKKKLTIPNMEEMQLTELGKLRTQDFLDKDLEFTKQAHTIVDDKVNELQEGNFPKCDSVTLKQLKLIRLFLQQKINDA